MKVILITGRARSGKDTTANITKKILEERKKSVLIAHYADLLKFICEKYVGWDGKKDEQGRALLQWLGTDVVRESDPDFWVDFVIMMLTLFDGNWDYVIIPDCRFPNEHTRMSESFPTVLWKTERKDETLTEEQVSHASESSVNDMEPSYSIDNNITIAELEEKLRTHLENDPWFFGEEQ